MILTLTIECVYGANLRNECVRVLEIDERASLYGLHKAIQTAVKFDEDHPFAFYVAYSWRGRKQWLAESESWEGQEAEFCRICLKDVFPLGGRKLHYLFDFGDDWTFEVRRSRQKPKAPQAGVKYPRVIERIGPNPEQYPDADF